jgi:archaellum component FlaC
MGLLGRRNQEEGMVEGEPSMLGSARRPEERQEAPPRDGQSRAEEHESPQHPEAGLGDEFAGARAGAPEGVRDQLERLATQIRGLQEQVEDLAARRSDAVAEQASQRVGAIVQAAEQSAAEISAEAHREAAELRERLRAESQAEADRIRVEAQADASEIRTEAHAAAARLREQTLAEMRGEIERITEELAERLRSAAREAIDRVAGSPAFPEEPAPEPHQPLAQEEFGPAEITATVDPELEEGAGVDADVEDAVDELQSAAAVLEQSLRHLQEIGQGLSEGQ